MITDVLLFAAIAEDDEVAFRTLFERYAPRIAPMIRAITRQDAPVKDLVQDVFLLLWTGRKKLTLVKSPENWIFRVAQYASYKWLRHQDVRKRAQVSLEATATDSQVLLNSTEEYSQFKETAALIRQAVEALPPQAKKVYLLRRERERSVDEIAHELQLSPQTVKNTMGRALASIEAFLKERGVIIPVFVLSTILQ